MLDNRRRENLVGVNPVLAEYHQIQNMVIINIVVSNFLLVCCQNQVYANEVFTSPADGAFSSFAAMPAIWRKTLVKASADS